MRRPSRTRLSRLWDVLVPWLVGAFLVLTVVDWADSESRGALTLLALVLAVVQARRSTGAAGARRSSPRSCSSQGSGSSCSCRTSCCRSPGSSPSARSPRVSIVGLLGLEAASAGGVRRGGRAAAPPRRVVNGRGPRAAG
jgi:hypothetical protein